MSPAAIDPSMLHGPCELRGLRSKLNAASSWVLRALESRRAPALSPAAGLEALDPGDPTIAPGDGAVTPWSSPSLLLEEVALRVAGCWVVAWPCDQTYASSSPTTELVLLRVTRAPSPAPKVGMRGTSCWLVLGLLLLPCTAPAPPGAAKGPGSAAAPAVGPKGAAEAAVGCT
jgi:hypothetical protein